MIELRVDQSKLRPGEIHALACRSSIKCRAPAFRFLLSRVQVEWIKDACTKIGNICDVATYKRYCVYLFGRGK
jgi:hypothetical protein